MKLAIVGATGLVGQKIIEIIEEKDFFYDELILVASEQSVGKKIICKNQTYFIVSIQEALQKKPNIAIFSAGSKLSLEYAPKFAAQNCFVVDNSSAWRMDPQKKLIVPEINANILSSEDKIIANPNCSTIQMVLPLSSLHQKYKIERLIISTYQSITGSGQRAVNQMDKERKGESVETYYPYTIDKNCLPHCDDFLDNGYTKEEMKLVSETQKILQDKEIKISATAVRVPVTGGHSESINISFKKEFEISEIIALLEKTKGVVVQDDIKNNIYPMPLTAFGKNEIFVGRIRKDISCSKAINMWIVADNLRKGAAWNALQIAKFIQDKNWV